MRRARMRGRSVSSIDTLSVLRDGNDLPLRAPERTSGSRAVRGTGTRRATPRGRSPRSAAPASARCGWRTPPGRRRCRGSPAPSRAPGSGNSASVPSTMPLRAVAGLDLELRPGDPAEVVGQFVRHRFGGVGCLLRNDNRLQGSALVGKQKCVRLKRKLRKEQRSDDRENSFSTHWTFKARETPRLE